MKLLVPSLLFFSTFVAGSAASLEDPNRALQGNGNGNGNGNSNGNGNGRGPPSWVLEKLPDVVVARFREDNMLRDDAEPNYQSVPGGSNAFDIDGTTISLSDSDLTPLSIMAKGGRITVDGKEQLLFPSVYKSKKDESIIVTKNSNGRLVSASKMSRGRSIKVLPITQDQDVYMTISSEDLDREKIDSSIIWEDEEYIKNRRNLRQLDMAAPDLVLEEAIGDRELQTSCSEFRVAEIGIFVDSYMCANEGSAQNAYDKAVTIVAQASQKYQAPGLCMKIEVLDIDIYCNAGSDPMRPYVSAQTSSVCNTFSSFSNWVGNSNNNPPNGDIIHLFSGRSYPNYSRCIGRAQLGSPSSYYYGGACYDNGYNCAVNEMSTWVAVDQDGLLAHEAGHNLGARHDSSGIMRSSGASGFSATSMSEINAYVTSNKGSCLATESPDGTEVTCAPASDDASWLGYYGTGSYDCAWLANQYNAAAYCAYYSVFETYCPATCLVAC